MSVPLEMVVAVAENGVIGANGDMPWHLSTDMKRFRGLTMGRPIIMGRKTFESIGRPLPGRVSIVVTRNADWHADGVTVVRDTDEAVAVAQEIAAENGATSIAVIGGGDIFAALAETCDKLHLTRVHARPEGDTFFPLPSPPQWAQMLAESVPAGPNDTAATTYEVWERRDTRT